MEVTSGVTLVSQKIIVPQENDAVYLAKCELLLPLLSGALDVADAY